MKWVDSLLAQMSQSFADTFPLACEEGAEIAARFYYRHRCVYMYHCVLMRISLDLFTCIIVCLFMHHCMLIHLLWYVHAYINICSHMYHCMLIYVISYVYEILILHVSQNEVSTCR